MRLLIDLQACQSISRRSGIGRYALELATAMARQSEGHELRLLLSDRLPDSIPEIYRRFADLIPRRHIQVMQLPGPVAEQNPGNQARARAAELVREACIQRFAPDLVHVASLFEGFLDDTVTSVGELRPGDDTAVTLYDLIPLVQRDTYLASPNTCAYYERKLASLRRAGGWLAISEFSRRQGIERLGLDPERVVDIAAGVDPQFRPLEPAPEQRAELCARYGLRGTFLLFAGSFDARKNHRRLIQAYARLAPEIRQGRQLVIIGNGWPGLYADLRRLGAGVGLGEGELVFTGHVADADLVALYNLCELFVFPSLAEGCGLPVLEAMACGVPVIASDTTSLPEVVGRLDALFDPYSVEDLAARMHQVLTDPDFGRTLAEHGPRRSRRFTWEASAKRAWEALVAQHERVRAVRAGPSAAEQESSTLAALRKPCRRLGRRDRVQVVSALVANARCLVDPDPPERRIGWITTWNSRCGIAMYAHYLAGHHLDDYRILAPELRERERVRPDEANVSRCWRIGRDDLRALSERIHAERLDTLVIQFNYGFFDFDAFGAFLREMIGTGRRLYPILHSTTDTPDKSLARLAEPLALCEAILVHSAHDESRLARLGLSANVERLPHGVPDIAPAPVALDIPAGRFVIASYGFFLPHKGLHELIEAAGLLRDVHRLDVHLLMINARYPILSSRRLIAQARRRIRALGLGDRVRLMTDFLDDPVSLGYLARADLVVYPYQHTGESSSAAVRMGLAARRPVAVTPLAIFDDVAGIVHRLPGTDPESLARGLAELAARLSAPNPDASLRLIHRKADAWFDAHRYSRLSERFGGFLRMLRTTPAD
jgi:glycosyltransferase involved in cell wall biosynthesis